MIGYIYKTTDLITGKIYIGQHKSVTFKGNRYIGSGRVIQAIRNSCVRKGVPIRSRLKVDLIEECETAQQLNEREIYWISYYNSTNPDIGYNLHKGGLNTLGEHNGMYGGYQSESSRRLNSEWHKCRIWMTNEVDDVFILPEDMPIYLAKNFRRGRSKIKSTGRKVTPETSKKISESLKNKSKSEEHRKNLSKSNIGKIWINNGKNSKRISPSCFDFYFSRGWKKGRK